jgi:hypothetical protein
MTTRASLEASFGPAADLAQHRCVICGGSDWAAMWMGAEHVHVCGSCAITTLPALIADALWRPHLTDREVVDHFKTIECQYWRAIALAVLRGARR